VIARWLRTRTFAAAFSSLFVSILFAETLAFAADKLRISYASVTGNTAGITYVAQRAGLFEKQGLDVELILITGGPASISALLNADVDLDMRAPVAALQAMAHGVKLTFLLSQSNTLEYDVVTRPEIKDIKQLKGKKVGIIRFGGISELMVRYLFQKLGLDADKDIAIVQVGQARFVALEKGAIDATVFASAESAYAKRSGFRILDMPTLPFFGSTIVASPAVLAKRADVMTRFMRGYLDGIRFFLNERERSSQYLADLLRTKDRDMIDLAYKNHPQHAMGRKPYPDVAAVKATIDVMGVRDPAVRKLKADELFTLNYLKQLDQNGYIDQLYPSK
jgi:ABC-type nitrate/sulfonate/bicarbonate transport system substrate-binding protein